MKPLVVVEEEQNVARAELGEHTPTLKNVVKRHLRAVRRRAIEPHTTLDYSRFQLRSEQLRYFLSVAFILVIGREILEDRPQIELKENESLKKFAQEREVLSEFLQGGGAVFTLALQDATHGIEKSRDLSIFVIYIFVVPENYSYHQRQSMVVCMMRVVELSSPPDRTSNKHHP